ncbi:AMP-binding enzyme family protein [Mycobacterium xenopi 3993]|nr:AMP-binding enzyme family protein [Mycobacterium xenopi 3993]
MHTHRGLLYQAADTNLVTEANRSDVMLATTPFFTAGGMVRTVSWLYLGQTMVIHQKFDPQAVIDEIEHSRITFTTFIPTMLQRTLAILEEGPRRDMSSLRRISYGSAQCHRVWRAGRWTCSAATCSNATDSPSVADRPPS